MSEKEIKNNTSTDDIIQFIQDEIEPHLDEYINYAEDKTSVDETGVLSEDEILSDAEAIAETVIQNSETSDSSVDESETIEKTKSEEDSVSEVDTVQTPESKVSTEEIEKEVSTEPESEVGTNTEKTPFVESDEQANDISATEEIHVEDFIAVSEPEPSVSESEMSSDNIPPQKKNTKKVILVILIIVCTIAACISAYMFLSKYINDRNSTSEYDAIRKDAVIEHGTTPIEQPTGIDDDDDSVLVVNPDIPFEIDFESLKSINKEIVAWIYIPYLDLSYPIVQGKDNSFYLNHTAEGTLLDAGAIFMDKDNDATFSDPNTLVYGHNMKNKAMFGKLWRIIDEKDESVKNPYVWIYTPEHIYRYKMFSAFDASPYSDAYALFGKRNKTFIEWCNKIKENSLVEFDKYTFTKDDYILTLSTCGFTSNTRTLVICYLDEEFKHYVLVSKDDLPTEMATLMIDETTVKEDLIY